MMIFKKRFDSETYDAVNTIKPVNICKLDEDAFFLNMPEGDLYNDFKIMEEFFETFEEAKKWAETYVGVKMNWEDL